VKGGLGQLMKQAKQMQETMQKAQEELASLEVTGEAGAGMVKVVMTGRYQVNRVSIDDSLIGEDRDMLEDLVAAACNDAVRKVSESTEQKFGGLAGGLQLPPGMKLPF